MHNENKLYCLVTINLTILAQDILGLYSVKGHVNLFKNHKKGKNTNKAKQKALKCNHHLVVVFFFSKNGHAYFDNSYSQ